MVSQVRNRLLGKSGVGLRIPLWVGLFLGYVADCISIFSKKNLPISSIRVKKFTSSSNFETAQADLDDFIPPFKLAEGVSRTLQSEFIDPDPEREIFLSDY